MQPTPNICYHRPHQPQVGYMRRKYVHVSRLLAAGCERLLFTPILTLVVDEADMWMRDFGLGADGARSALTANPVVVFGPEKSVG